jgi:site-specific DNA-methyltransferase (adenine-specific)
LKPAFEPIVMARKPLTGTVAANVQTHGTGALNIDATRINPGSQVPGGGNGKANHGGRFGGDGGTSGERPRVESHSAGRWPANVVLDERMAAVLDGQSGTLTSGANPTRRNSPKFGNAYGEFDGGAETPARGQDSGGASRFFYVAKAPKKERPVVEGVAHPTVKPLALMRWLIRLVTPPGGVVLDPFEGSGTTLEACLLEGFDHVGIEREADYLPLIGARLDRQAGTLPVAA